MLVPLISFRFFLDKLEIHLKLVKCNVREHVSFSQQKKVWQWENEEHQLNSKVTTQALISMLYVKANRIANAQEVFLFI